MARSAYVNGKMEVEEFEDCAAHVLAGGFLNQHGKRSTSADLRSMSVISINELRDSCGRPLVCGTDGASSFLGYQPLTLDTASE